MNRVLYCSRGGNTQKVAEAIAKGAGVTAQKLRKKNPPVVTGTGVLFVGSALYAGQLAPALTAFLNTLKPTDVAQVVVFSTSATKDTALPHVKAILTPKGIGVLEIDFHCKGAFLFMNWGSPTAVDLKRAKAFAKEVCQRYEDGKAQ